MKEITQDTYYSSIENKYVDIHLSIKACLETFLSNLLFKGDLKRVMFSQPDILFRQRMEYLDNGKPQDNNLTPMSLNLPFANYYQSTDFEEDDRTAAIQSGQAIIGEYSEILGRRLRSLPVKATYKIQAFFSRRDETRVASQLLHWERSPKFPVHFYDIRYYRNFPVAIPVNFTVESISSNPEWKETDFLKNQRIFPIEVQVTVRTYQILINNVDNVVDLPIRVHKKYAQKDFSKDDIYLTNETLLLWSAEKFDLDMQPLEPDENTTEIAELYFDTGEPTEEQLEWVGGKIYNNQTMDIISAYFENDDRNILNYYCQDIERTTTTQTVIKFDVNEDFRDRVFRIIFLIPARERIEVSDMEQGEVVVDNLFPNSKYFVKILVYMKDYGRKLYNLTIKTKVDGKSCGIDMNKSDTIEDTEGILDVESFDDKMTIVDDIDGTLEARGDNIKQEPILRKLSALVGKNI